MTPPSAPRVLAVRFSAIGDIVLTTPLIRALRARHPEGHITFLTKRSYLELVRDNPAIDRVWTLEPGESLGSLASRIRRENFSHLLDLHGSLRTRLLRLLAPGNWSGYPKRRLARTALVRTKLDLYPDPPEHVAERYFAAASSLDVAPDGRTAEIMVTESMRSAAQQWLASAGLAGEGLVAVAPRAAHETKCWPVDSWAELVGRLTSSGKNVVVLGGPDDTGPCGLVAGAGGSRAASAAGQMSLSGTAALLARSSVAAAGDTGVMHMATAVGIPVVALYGPTVAQFGFMPYRASATVIQRDLPCRPCSKMGGPRCPLGHHDCLRGITVAEVFQAIMERE